MESRPGEQRYNALAISKRANAPRQGRDPEVGLRQTQIIDVGAASLECTVNGSEDPHYQLHGIAQETCKTLKKPSGETR